MGSGWHQRAARCSPPSSAALRLHSSPTWHIGPQGAQVKSSKRDARHYFHRLKVGKRWKRWLAGPGFWHQGRKWYPRHCATPMGVGASAGWAQALTDQVTEAAGMPESHRCTLASLIPEELPMWGSTIDDVRTRTLSRAWFGVRTQPRCGPCVEWSQTVTKMSAVSRAKRYKVFVHRHACIGQECQFTSVGR